MDLGKRIMIMGGSGSGKSTIAREIGAQLGLPVVHMDTIWWQAGWVATPKDEAHARSIAAADEPAWVFEGNMSKTRDYRLARADTVIYLDFGRCIRLWRVIKRRVVYHKKSRPDMAEGCNEKIDWEFLKFVWGYQKQSRGKTLAWLAEIKPPKRVVHLKGRRAVKEFLAELKIKS